MVKVKDILINITYLAVVISYISVAEYVKIEYSALFFMLLLLSVFSTYRYPIRIPRWILNSISLLVMTISLLRIDSTYLVEPILDALIVLGGIKLIEDKKFRDYMQIYTICMFLLLGSSFISLSIIFLMYLSVLIFLLTISLLLLAYFARDPEMLIPQNAMFKITCSSILICALSIPATVFFFIILPRTNYPLFSFLNKYGYAKTGFSENVTLGEVSAIQEDNNVIFRVEMNEVNEASLYWRGIVLDRFDGKSWDSSYEPPATGVKEIKGKKVRQTIYLEPYGNRYLFALDKPIYISFEKRILVPQVHALSTGDRIYFMDEEITKRIKYESMSVLSDLLPEDEIDRKRYLQIPGNYSPKIRQLVKELSEGKSQDQQLNTFYRLLKWGDYKYTMKDLPASHDPLETFLFDHKKGNCEFFASSLAVMLRMAGIPSRLVGGYRGGYYNNTGKYYLVSQKNAHVWVEVYLEGQGWMRVDPTTSIMADGSSVSSKDIFLLKARMLLDSLNYYWNKFVINYDFGKQLSLARKIQSTLKRPHLSMHINRAALEKISLWALTFLTFMALAYMALTKRRSATERLITKFTGRMSRYGYEKSTSEGLEEFLTRIDKEEIKIRAYHFVKDFEELYYRDIPLSKKDIKRLENRIREI